MGKAKTQCYIDDANVLAFERGHAFVALIRRDDGGVFVTSLGRIALNKSQCRKLAEWLSRTSKGKKGS